MSQQVTHDDVGEPIDRSDVNDVLAHLVDVKTIAARMGVPDRTVHTWLARSTRADSPRWVEHPTPEPVAHWAQGVPVWVWEDWVEWAQATNRQVLHPDATVEYGSEG